MAKTRKRETRVTCHNLKRLGAGKLLEAYVSIEKERKKGVTGEGAR